MREILDQMGLQIVIIACVSGLLAYKLFKVAYVFYRQWSVLRHTPTAPG